MSSGGCKSLYILGFLICMQLPLMHAHLEELPLLTQELKALEVEAIFMVSVRTT